MSFAVIFDMDGVLVNTVPHLVPSYNSILREHGHDITDDDFREYNGMKMMEIVLAFNRRFDLTFEPEEFIARADAFQLERMREVGESYPEAHRLIESLLMREIPIAVATASRRGRAEALLQIGKYEIPILVTIDDVARGKPDPGLFLETSRRLGIPPERCIVIEDAPNGIEAAYRGDMKAIALTSDLHPSSDFPERTRKVGSLGELTYDRLLELVQD